MMLFQTRNGCLHSNSSKRGKCLRAACLHLLDLAAQQRRHAYVLVVSDAIPLPEKRLVPFRFSFRLSRACLDKQSSTFITWPCTTVYDTVTKKRVACHLRRAQLDRAVRCRAPHIRDAPYVVGVEPLRALIVNCKWTQRVESSTGGLVLIQMQ